MSIGNECLPSGWCVTFSFTMAAAPTTPPNAVFYLSISSADSPQSHNHDVLSTRSYGLDLLYYTLAEMPNYQAGTTRFVLTPQSYLDSAASSQAMAQHTDDTEYGFVCAWSDPARGNSQNPSNVAPITCSMNCLGGDPSVDAWQLDCHVPGLRNLANLGMLSGWLLQSCQHQLRSARPRPRERPAAPHDVQ
jgi:hypothetical protein